MWGEDWGLPDACVIIQVLERREPFLVVIREGDVTTEGQRVVTRLTFLTRVYWSIVALQYCVSFCCITQ